MDKKAEEGTLLSKALEALKPLKGEVNLWGLVSTADGISLILGTGDNTEIIVERNGELVTVDYLKSPSTELGQKARKLLREAKIQVKGQPSISEEKD